MTSCVDSRVTAETFPMRPHDDAGNSCQTKRRASLTTRGKASFYCRNGCSGSVTERLAAENSNQDPWSSTKTAAFMFLLFSELGIVSAAKIYRDFVCV